MKDEPVMGQKRKAKPKGKVCPFNPNLACGDCRLYRNFAGGEWTCCFKHMARVL